VSYVALAEECDEVGSLSRVHDWSAIFYEHKPNLSQLESDVGPAHSKMLGSFAVSDRKCDAREVLRFRRHFREKGASAAIFPKNLSTFFVHQICRAKHFFC
jgi:hypothetical protein